MSTLSKIFNTENLQPASTGSALNAPHAELGWTYMQLTERYGTAHMDSVPFKRSSDNVFLDEDFRDKLAKSDAHIRRAVEFRKVDRWGLSMIMTVELNEDDRAMHISWKPLTGADRDNFDQIMSEMQSTYGEAREDVEGLVRSQIWLRDDYEIVVKGAPLEDNVEDLCVTMKFTGYER